MRRVTVSWDSLRVTKEERTALREAGLVPADVLALRPDDLVGATDELISRSRAIEIAGRASLARAGIGPATIETVSLLGVRDREDLASRDPETLCVQALHDKYYADSKLYDRIAQAVYLAQTDSPARERLSTNWWCRDRRARGYDAMLPYWREVHGPDTPLPTPTGDRLVIPRLRVKVRVWAADRPVWPLEGGVVRAGRVVIGHHLWRGAQMSFHFLERLEAGDEVRLAGHAYEVETVGMGEPAEPDEGLVLATPPHRRANQDGIFQVVVRCVEAG
jgi:hypothetical protein